TLVAVRDPAAFARLGEAVALTTDARLRAERALELTRALGMAGLQEEAVETCRRAIGERAGAPPELVGRLEAELAANAYSSPATQPLAEPALAALERRAEDSPELASLVLAHRSVATARHDSAAAAAALADSAFSAGLLLEDGSLAITLALLVLIWADRLP